MQQLKGFILHKLLSGCLYRLDVLLGTYLYTSASNSRSGLRMIESTHKETGNVVDNRWVTTEVESQSSDGQCCANCRCGPSIGPYSGLNPVLELCPVKLLGLLLEVLVAVLHGLLSTVIDVAHRLECA